MIFVFPIAVVLSALFSGLETGIYTTSRLRLFLDAQDGVRAAKKARELLADIPGLLSVLLVANNVANWGASFSAQAILIAAGVQNSELVGTLAVTVVLFLCSESVPKSAFRRGRERLLYPCMPLLAASDWLLSRLVAPISWFAEQLTRVVQQRLGGAARGGGRRQAVLDAGASEGFLTGFQNRVARGVLAMRSRTAGDEALPLERFPTVCLAGDEGGSWPPEVPDTQRRGAVRLPTGSREHRCLVLDPRGQRVLGWTPLAVLWQPEGFRSPRRNELQPVVRVEAATGLDLAYVDLDRRQAPFAVLPDRRILDANLLRQAVMGRLGGAGDAGPE